MDFSHSRRPLLSSGPFICTKPDCGKSFLRKEHLNRHLAVHANSRPHKCFICGRTFARSDILNRHVLQHNVPPDTSKRTPLACQTCRRRKTKCDSQHPCATCADTGEACMREPSSMQASMPMTRSRRKNPFGEEEEPMETMEENDFEEKETGMVSSTESTSPMQQDWVPPMNRGDRNSILSSSTRPTSVSAEQEPLLDPCISMAPGDSVATSTTGRMPSLGPSEPPSLLNFAFESSLPQSSESSDRFSTGQPSEVQMKETTSFATKRTFSEASASERVTVPVSSSGWLQLHEAIASQIQFVTTQIQSAEFDHFHQIWPLLHVPTFTPKKHTPLLTSALANLAMGVQDANRHHLVPYAINQELTQALMPKITDELLTEKPAADVPLQTMQAMVITLIYAVLGDAPVATLNWAAQWTDITISTFRRIGALSNQWLPEDQGLSAEERWVACEEMKRLVYSIMRVDAYLCIILDRPPTLRYQEMGQPLPVSEALWRAETRVARTQLHWNEPAGRARSAFSTMMRDGLDTAGFVTGYLQMPYLSLEDNHFSLCAFLSELWGVCKEAHEEHHRHYRSPERNHTADLLRSWKVYLHEWRVHIEKTDELEETFFAGFSGDRNLFLGLNLTLYHLVSLKVYANLQLLERKKCCAQCQEADVENVIRAWAQSSDGRQAAYHAAQLKRVYEHESTLYKPGVHRLSNVLAPAGLLASAVVLCLYSAKVPGDTTEGDAVTAPVEAVELIQAKLTDMPEYQTWISQGGLATVDGVLLHAFSVPRFSSWYRDQLTSYPVYSSRLVAFLLTLKI